MRPPAGDDSLRRVSALAALFASLLFFLVSTCQGSAVPSPAPLPPAADADVIVSVDLNGEPLLDGVLALDRGGRLFLPVCSLAEALSLAVRCTEGRAYGFLVQESRPFLIDLEEGYLMSQRSVAPLSDQAFAANNDIYVDREFLSRWLPVDLVWEKDAMTLHVHPRELLPMQALKKRTQQAGFRPDSPVPSRRDSDGKAAARALASIPAVDLTSQLQLWGERSGSQALARTTLQMAGDLLCLSGVAHVAFDNEASQRLDLTLFKRRENPFLIGPLPVSQFQVGAAQLPTVDGIGGSTTTMYGMALSNRPLSGASQFLFHDMDGYLPEGWDAELLHNGVPVAYQPPSEDGMYHFKNLRVHYGINDFKVILHGPFGETRLSEETFATDATTPKGDFLYTLSTAWQTGLTDRREPGVGRESNVIFTSDFGITEGLTGSALLVRRTGASDNAETYVGAGVRSALGHTLISVDLLQRFAGGEGGGGELLTVKSSGRYLTDVSVESALRLFRDFSSPQFEQDADPLVAQGSLKGSTSVAGWSEVRLPLSAQLNAEWRRSGRTDLTSACRVSGGWNGWNAALEGDLSYQQEEISAGGVLQVSTLIKGGSVRGQVGFSVAPSLTPALVNLSADREVGGGLLLNSTFSHDAVNGVSALRVGLSKKMGVVGYAISAIGDTSGAYGVNVAVSTSLAADRINSQILVSSEPLSSYGMVAASAVISSAPGSPEKQARTVGFLVNGGRALTVTGSEGIPIVAYLQPDIPVEITVDVATLDDPFMVPLEDVCRIVPRAGVVSPCRFTLVTGGEIDGMVLASLPGGQAPIKGVRVNLAREDGGGAEVVASTVTEETGYYLFKAVRPGRYRIAIPDGERVRLKVQPTPPLAVTMPEGGDQVTGNDFILNRRNGGG